MAKFLWTQRTDFGPSSRSTSVTAYDSNRSRVVMFGGSGPSNATFGDTWEWDGSFWTQMEDIGPAPRFHSAMIYDTADRVSLLFGGSPSLFQGTGDTWQWDGTAWTQLSDSGPGARFSHAMAYDSTRNRTVLFGGVSPSGPVFSDTWEFDGQDWTQQQDTGPSPRGYHSMAYDSVGGRVVLFGGLIPDGTAALGDTWAWDGKEWVQIAEFGPSARVDSPLVSTGSGNLILYGGVPSLDPDRVPEADTWQFDGKHWTQVQDIGPGPLQAPAMAFDSGRSRVVLFGGLVVPESADAKTPAQFSADTWESPITPAVIPPPVSVASLSVPGSVSNNTPVPLTINLTGPAAGGGVLVNITGPVSLPGGAALPSVMIPAGLRTFIVTVAFHGTAIFGGTVSITAQTAGTPAASLLVTILPFA